MQSRWVFRWSWKTHLDYIHALHPDNIWPTPEGKRPLGRPRHRWEDNIMMYLQEVGYGCMDWIELAQDTDRWQALVNAVMNLRVP
jgi:hypothetical protein